jgi:hypothetical protein
MLGSMGIKDEIMLYCIGYGGYGITLSCNAISGVTGYCQPRCWLTNVGWVVKLGYDQICGTGTPTCVDDVLIAIGGREVMNSSPIYALIYYPHKDNFWIHVLLTICTNYCNFNSGLWVCN